MNIIETTLVLVLTIIMVGCNTIKVGKMNERDHELVKTIKICLRKNKTILSANASFVYEEDTFKGPKRIFSKNEWSLGQWSITYNKKEKTYYARASKYYGDDQEWESDDIEIKMVVKDGKLIVDDYDACTSWGEILSEE